MVLLRLVINRSFVFCIFRRCHFRYKDNPSGLLRRSAYEFTLFLTAIMFLIYKEDLIFGVYFQLNWRVRNWVFLWTSAYYGCKTIRWIPLTSSIFYWSVEIRDWNGHLRDWIAGLFRIYILRYSSHYRLKFYGNRSRLRSSVSVGGLYDSVGKIYDSVR